MSGVLSIHHAATWMLVGLIWCVQMLIYPQFHHLAVEKFRERHHAHCFRIGLIVVPLMLTEAATAAWLLYDGVRSAAFIAGACLIPVVWLSTALLQAPMHTRLMGGFDAPLIRHLILTNWIRTLAWTARGVLVSVSAA